tara:strand:+ start:3092 stop:3223 length:132 start_codon:yes stop_codon:yes gene_type:complete
MPIGNAAPTPNPQAESAQGNFPGYHKRKKSASVAVKSGVGAVL